MKKGEKTSDYILISFILDVNPDSKCEDVGVSWLSFKINQSVNNFGTMLF